MPTKRIRRHGAAPANWQFREGRPRWIPAPGLRRAGWRGVNLKDPRTDAWLSQGASVDRALAINAAVDAWRAGVAVPPDIAPFAPADALERGAPAAHARSIGTLLEAWMGTDKTHADASAEFRALAANTQSSYRKKLKRLVDVMAGWSDLPGADATAEQRAAYAADVAAVRADSVDILAPPPQGSLARSILYTAYHKAKTELGVTMASAMLAAASAWLQWCLEIHNAITLNPARLVTRETPPGRLRVGTWEEVQALVKAADSLGLLSVGDAIVLGVDLSWSQIDRISLTWNRLVDGRAFTGTAGRTKTGRVGGTPLLDLGRARVEQIRARQATWAAQPTHVMWCEATNAPWKSDYYRRVFREVRALAAQTVPSVADLTDQDLRDTAFTMGRIAGLNDDQTASRTLQSRKRIAHLADKHYGEIGAEIADQGRDKLNTYMAGKGMRL